MIKIEDYNKEKMKLKFVTDMPTYLANAIRRSVLEIPTMAIDEIEIFKNDSALYDEIIAHRLGLVPIKTEKTVKTTKFKLKEKGPKMVYSTDLSPSVGTPFKIPIVILDSQQEIELVADARLGNGLEHSKYTPGLVYFKHNLDSEIESFVSVNDSGKVSYDEEEINSLNIPDEVLNKIKKTKEVKEIMFNIESWGQIDTREIFTRAIEALEDNLKEIEGKIK